MRKEPSLTPKFPAFLHGSDYNPDQWLDRPDILEKDVELMVKAHVNCVSLGIFSWALLEPEEGVYRLEWLDSVIDRLWQNGIHVILATPSGARPAWMAQRYPEVLRVDDHFQRRRFGERHNHCPSSPVFRTKTAAIDTILAQRYGNHPAVILWHLSNEYSGDCYCPLCAERFRGWLKDKYGTLEKLNQSWWTSFWSMSYTDWSQIDPPSPMGQMSNTSMLVDWRRFSTAQCKAFIRMEKEAVKSAAPDLPVTANLMFRFYDYDYFSLAEELDVVSWDAYPEWHNGDDEMEAARFAMWHDLMRSLKQQPFLLMESTPSLVNWKPVNKLKKPGMHLLSSIQAVAHGSVSVQYFQWRKGRGGAEMFHGAVVDHNGRDDTRTFLQVRAVGEALERLAPMYGQKDVPAEVCLVYDWENRWALDAAQAARAHDMRYTETVAMHYHGLWRAGAKVDFCDMRADTSLKGYKLVAAPLLFMFRNDMHEKLKAFVANGGTLLITCFSGVVDACDEAFLGDAPWGLTDVLGLRVEEVDALTDEQHNSMVFPDGRQYRVDRLCEIPVLEGAEAVACYGEDYYAGVPCLTRHVYGKGEAWYLSCMPEQAALDAFYSSLVKRLGLSVSLPEGQPDGISAVSRAGVIFVQNWRAEPRTPHLPGTYTDLLTGERIENGSVLQGFGVWALSQLQ